jgi:endonuclease/exonuclease/phosphatase family metal-dependent hydrolase
VTNHSKDLMTKTSSVKQGLPETAMRIVTYNIQWGKGRDGVVDLDRIAHTISSADVIALQEVERHWRDMEHADQVARLSALMPDHHPAFCTAVDFHNPQNPAERRQYGLMVLSRWPILSVRSWPLPRATVVGQVSDPSILMECVIDHPTRPFRLYVTHLNWISPRVRLQQAEAVLRIVPTALDEGPLINGPDAPDSDFCADWMMVPRDEVPPMPAPAILTGDFNMTPASPEYTALCGPLTPWAGRLIEQGLFTDALTLAGMAEAEGVTFPGVDGNPDERIDHILVTPDLAPLVRAGWIDDAADGSDHQPVWAEINLAD